MKKSLIILVFLQRTLFAQTSDPSELVLQKYQEIKELVKKYPEKEDFHKAIRDIMDTFVEYRELSKRTLSDEWDKLKKKQQDEFVNEFKKMIQRTYVKRFDPNKEVEVLKREDTKIEQDGTVTVFSTIKSGKSEVKVDYRFLKKGGQWWAFDVIIDDVSMVQKYRKQFHDIMSKEGFEGLMQRIKKKNAKSQE